MIAHRISRHGITTPHHVVICCAQVATPEEHRAVADVLDREFKVGVAYTVIRAAYRRSINPVPA